MDGRYLVLIAVALGAAGATACSGPPPGLVSFSEAGVTASSDDDEEEEEEESSPKSASPKTVNAVFADEVYPAVQTACGSCHLSGTGGAPVFFGEDAAETYAMFKQRGFDEDDSIFVTKGQHSGPALTAAQKAAVEEWVADEAE